MALRLVSGDGPACPWIGDFREQLEEQYRRLGVPPPAPVSAVAGAHAPPELLIYFAHAPWDPAAAPQLASDLRDYAGAAPRLLPVLDQPAHASAHLPPEILRFNAFLRAVHGAAWPEALVDEVLTLIWQRRRSRRIFISYRRSESLEIARQLHDRYTARSFEVFLDERSIEPGVDFQRELCRELDDSDAVLLLVTPALTTSRWVREEIQLATTRRVGLLGLIWPADGAGDPMASAAARQIPDDLRLQLAPLAPAADPAARRLSDEELARVDHLLFTGRSQSIASRIRDLVDCARQELRDFTVLAWRADGDLDLELDGARWLGRVVPFRPDVYTLWTWWEEQRVRPSPPAGLVVLYPQLDPRDLHEIAFRAVCDAWCATVTPAVLLRTVHV